MFATYGAKCFKCKKEEVVLQIHHERYTKRNLLGTNLEFLCILCKECHEQIEFYRNGNKKENPSNFNKTQEACQKISEYKKSKVGKSDPRYWIKSKAKQELSQRLAEKYVKDKEDHSAAKDAKLKAQLEEIGDFEEIKRRGL